MDGAGVAENGALVLRMELIFVGKELMLVWMELVLVWMELVFRTRRIDKEETTLPKLEQKPLKSL